MSQPIFAKRAPILVLEERVTFESASGGNCRFNSGSDNVFTIGYDWVARVIGKDNSTLWKNKDLSHPAKSEKGKEGREGLQIYFSQKVIYVPPQLEANDHLFLLEDTGLTYFPVSYIPRSLVRSIRVTN